MGFSNMHGIFAKLNLSSIDIYLDDCFLTWLKNCCIIKHTKWIEGFVQNEQNRNRFSIEK